jgi:type I restriction enzyme R subunit
LVVQFSAAIEVREPKPDEEEKLYDISKINFDRLRQEFEHSPKKNTLVQNLREAVEKRLRKLLRQNPLRADFQQHYEQIVAEYNREKDRATIEQTFEALFTFSQTLDEEQDRAIREGLDEESLAIFDLLNKSDLTAGEIKRIKAISVQLLETLKAEKLRIDHWRDKEFTRDAVRVTIHDFLWGEATGLPADSFTEKDVDDKTDDVFRHIYRAYPSLPSPFYDAQPMR